MSLFGENSVKGGQHVLHEVGLSVEADYHIEEGIDVGLGVFLEQFPLALLVPFVEDEEVVNSFDLKCRILA